MPAYTGNLAFLSNSFKATVTFDGAKYPTVVHAYQAAKTLDRDIRRLISQLGSTRDVYAFGRKIDVREDWNDIKKHVMLQLVRDKFTNPFFAAMLVDTSEDDIGEGWLASILKDVRSEVVQRQALDAVLCTPTIR